MISVYRLLMNLAVIFSPLIILIRLIKKKEDPIRYKEKFTFFSKKRKKGNLVWFHGASVGELISVIPLIEKLEKNKNIKQILVTTSTLSSSKIFNKFSTIKILNIKALRFDRNHCPLHKGNFNLSIEHISPHYNQAPA